MHVVDPDRYPLAPTAIYRPSPFNVSQAIDFEASIGVSQLVIVQPSIYGTDNSCLLDALRAFGPTRARGVVAFDPATTLPSTLCEWHRLGVRGVRLNLRSAEHAMEPAKMKAVLRSYADAVRPLDWVIQLYIPLDMVKTLEQVMPNLGVRVCIDHMGSPDLSSQQKTMSRLDPYTLNGFSSLVRLLQGGNTYVKLSAPYRLTTGMDYIRDVGIVARELIRVAGRTSAVFASDWPHTRFEGLDIRPWIEHVLSWCGGSQHLAERIFRDNAHELWA
jgi:predicted TIM-barrel fold metal-dependent hydrolase